MTTAIASTLMVNRPKGKLPPFGPSFSGNLTILPYEMALASGVFTLSDNASAIGIADKIILGVIPKGTKLIDALIRSTIPLGDANCTLDIGFEYVDGVDVAAPNAEDVDYFCDALAASSSLNVHATNKVAPITLPKDAYLIVTVNTAAFKTSGSGSLFINLYGICDQPY